MNGMEWLNVVSFPRSHPSVSAQSHSVLMAFETLIPFDFAYNSIFSSRDREIDALTHTFLVFGLDIYRLVVV